MKEYYRKDIDGLRAICVFSVIFVHLGILEGGSIDVFFVISGFLITSIIQRKKKEGTFSLKTFYEKRIRRILPMLLFLNAVILIVGCYFMLPDDLENTAESVVATNFFSNNLLLYLTKNSYWAPDSKFKPLLHTWTLSIEEQFYLLYPLLLLFIRNSKKLFRVLIILSCFSLLLFLFTKNSMIRYYFPHTRFFEIGAGALVAFAQKEIKWGVYVRLVALVLLTALLFFNHYLAVPFIFKVPLIVLATSALLLPAKQPALIKFLLENRVIRWFGLMSYSLYLWHQPVFAFTRYAFHPIIDGWVIALVLAIVIGLSVFSYYCIEQPFRNRNKINKRTLYGVLGLLMITTTTAGLYIYTKAGVLRNVPELDITMHDIKRNMHAKYNDRIYKYDRSFTTTNKVKVLVTGHSFSRDWANVLLQSDYRNSIEISYIFNLNNSEDAKQRITEADVIYFSPIDTIQFSALKRKFDIDIHKVKITGMKNFGVSNGIFYNQRNMPGYCAQRVTPLRVFVKYNNAFKAQWGNKYIDLLAMVADENGDLPVFTPNCKFISQDCKHFTEAGAAYYATLINGKLTELEKK